MREGIPWNQMEVVQDGKGQFSDCRDKTDGRGISTVIPVEEIQKSFSARTAIGLVIDDHQLRNEPLTDEPLKKCRRKRKSSVEGVLKKCKKKVVVTEVVTIFFYNFSPRKVIIRKKGRSVQPGSSYKKKSNSNEFIIRKKGTSALPGCSYKKKTNSKAAYDNGKIMFPNLLSPSTLNLSISKVK